MTNDEILSINRRVAELAGIELAEQFGDLPMIAAEGYDDQWRQWSPMTDISQALLALERYCEKRGLGCTIMLKDGATWRVYLIGTDGDPVASPGEGPLAEAICRAIVAAGGEG